MMTSPRDRRDTGRDADGGALLHTLISNLRLALRRLRKSPGFTATAILSLAIGIGANTAIFSLVNAILLRELPLRAPEELVEVYLSTPDFEYNVFSYPDYEDFRDGTEDVFSSVAATRLFMTQADRDGTVETVPGEAVSGNYFETLGIEVRLGRALFPEDDLSPGAHPVVVLGHGYWQDRYGGDPAIVGREIRLGGRAYTVVGVAPESFPGSFRALVPAVYAPRMMINELMPGDSNDLVTRGNHSVFVKARLRPGTSIVEARGAADAVASHLAEQNLDDWDPAGRFLLIPREDVVFMPMIDPYIRAASWLLMVVVGLVLLMACINLASFLLARALEHRKEVAVRLALGAGRRSLVTQALTETTLLAVLGGALGVALAVGLLHLLVTADLPLPLPLQLDLTLDANVLGYCFGISLLAGLLLGLGPALRSVRGDLSSTLRSESAGSGGGQKQRLRNGLVIAQVAISLVLLLVAGLFLRSMEKAGSVDPGFGRRPTALLSFLIPSTRFDAVQATALADRLVERLAQVPGVESIGLIDNLPLNTMNTQTFDFNVDGVEPPAGREAHLADRVVVDGGYFEAAGVRMVEGRIFDDRDATDTQAVAVVSEALARRFWPDGDAVGQTLRLGDPDRADLRIVGVASDTKVRSLGEAPRALVYLPLSQRYSSFLTVVAPTRVDPESTALALVAAAREVDPELFVWEAKSMDEHLGIVLLPARLSASVLSAFAFLALALAIVGLHGIVSYSVAQRRREVGIRISLGADSAGIVRLMMGTGLRLVVVGGAVGLGLAVLLARLLGGLLFGIGALDPATFVVFPLILVGAAAIATLIPALAARRINPASVLRSE